MIVVPEISRKLRWCKIISSSKENFRLRINIVFHGGVIIKRLRKIIKETRKNLC